MNTNRLPIFYDSSLSCKVLCSPNIGVETLTLFLIVIPSLISNDLFQFIISVDVTVYHRGFHGDLNETFLLGQVSDTARKLTQTTWECLDKAIKIGNYYFLPSYPLQLFGASVQELKYISLAVHNF